MKKLLLTFVVLMIGIVAFASNNNPNKEESKQLIFGKVIDKISGEEIAGAEIILDDKIIYTDLNGNFSAKINVNKPELIVKTISYTDTKIIVDLFSYNTIVVEITPKED